MLGDCIIDNLKDILTKQQLKHFKSIDHPFFLNIGVLINNSLGVLKIGTVGELNTYKGANDYLELIKKLSGDIKNKFSLYAIGAVKDNYEELLENGVIIPGVNMA